MNANAANLGAKASPAPQRPLRIVKVGGSLFDLPDLPQRLDHLLHTVVGTAEPCCNLLVPGGGALADAVRRYDAVLHLDAACAHGVAVETMNLMALMLSQAAAKPIVSQMVEIAACRENGETAILDVRDLLSSVEPTAEGQVLERSWAVTSDSIAARIAQMLIADELWLLKSVTPRDAANMDQLVRDDIVDPCFSEHASGLRWRLINLRQLDLGRLPDSSL